MNFKPKYIGRANKVQKDCTFFVSNWGEGSNSNQVVCYGNKSRIMKGKCTKKVSFGFKKFEKSKTFMHNNPYILQPKIKPIISEGRLSYNENVRCNNVLRFKKEIREEFTDLSNKSNLISYRIEFYRNYEELQNRITQVINNKIGLPFLLFLFKNEKGDKEL